MEVVRGKDAWMAVRVMVHLGEQPRYHGQAMIDALAKKMRLEYGDPPKSSTRTPAPPDAGADGSN